jgi:hypothetical protein
MSEEVVHILAIRRHGTIHIGVTSVFIGADFRQDDVD